MEEFDYYAIAAMQGLLSNDSVMRAMAEINSDPKVINGKVAAWACQIADETLKEADKYK